VGRAVVQAPSDAAQWNATGACGVVAITKPGPERECGGRGEGKIHRYSSLVSETRKCSLVLGEKRGVGLRWRRLKDIGADVLGLL